MILFSFFHECEFGFVALYHSKNVSTDSFLLNNGYLFLINIYNYN